MGAYGNQSCLIATIAIHMPRAILVYVSVQTAPSLQALPVEFAGREAILARVLGETISGRRAGCHRGLEGSKRFLRGRSA